jgi:hypothetical protein
MILILMIVLLCLLCGGFFAYLATRLHTTKGNTISDILNSQHFADSQAIRVELLDKVKISSNVPIVALYIVAFFVAGALPALISYLTLKDVTTITLSGKVRKDPNMKVYVMPSHMRIEESGSFTLPLVYSSEPTTINIEGHDISPSSLKISINKLHNSVSVEITNSTTEGSKFEVPLRLPSMTADLTEAILLKPAHEEANPPNSPSANDSAPLRSDLENAGSPIGVAR